MKTNVVVQTTALSKVAGNGPLREGSSVYVRVIKNNGNNSYTVAFSGGRFMIKSEVALKEGAGFIAKIKLDGGKILLQKLEGQKTVSNTVQKLNSEGQKVYLQNLGLIPDNISLSLFQQMKELGVKFNHNILAKSRKIGLSFKDKEKHAAQIAFLLEEKGVAADEEAVRGILEDRSSEDNGSSKEMNYFSSNTVSDSFADIKDFFQSVIRGYTGQNNPAGLLALFNHLGFNFECPKSFGNWIKIPFDFINENNSGTGCFCAFIRNDTKKIQKATVDIQFSENKYYFGLKFGEGGLTGLRAGCSEVKKSECLLNLLQASFSNVDVEYFEPDEYTRFYADDTGIEIFRGQA